jgi:hypothetical protein
MPQSNADDPGRIEPYPPDPYALAREAEALRAENAHLRSALDATRMALDGISATLRTVTQPPPPAPPPGGVS